MAQYHKSSKASTTTGKKNNIWSTNVNRHYCEYCNVWMANDRQSIMLHENGKKHCLNVEKFLEEKRKNKLAQTKEAKLLQKSLQTMQQVAFEQHIRQDLHHNYYQDEEQTTTTATTASAAINETADNSSKSGSVDKDGQKKKREWEQKKKQREAENKKRKTSQGDQESLQKKPKKRRLGPNEGHYSVDDKTYLEGTTYRDLLEDDMAVQIWVGSSMATMGEKRLPSYHHMWRQGLVVRVVQRETTTEQQDLTEPQEKTIRVDVAYLARDDAEEETLEKSVPLNRIRLLLGGDDERLPNTLEEARLSIQDDVVIRVTPNNTNNGTDATTTTGANVPVLDENTGLSSWGTVEIRKTTVHKEQRQERERARAKRREEQQRLEQERRKEQERRMEESKVDNAQDSAMGALFLDTSTQHSYKGVDIVGGGAASSSSSVSHHTVSVGAKSLADGAPVAFKKKKKKKKMLNKRKTSADDD